VCSSVSSTFSSMLEVLKMSSGILASIKFNP
jgi:hypothetical protein